jgi:hypothetical protein
MLPSIEVNFNITFYYITLLLSQVRIEIKYASSDSGHCCTSVLVKPFYLIETLDTYVKLTPTTKPMYMSTPPNSELINLFQKQFKFHFI